VSVLENDNQCAEGRGDREQIESDGLEGREDRTEAAEQCKERATDDQGRYRRKAISDNGFIIGVECRDAANASRCASNSREASGRKRLEALAGGRALGEWVREVLLRELDGRQARPAEQTVLTEVLALRTILLNGFYRLAEREKLTAGELQSFIERADATKLQKAAERLTAKTGS
jgi:hypothetical protein